VPTSPIRLQTEVETFAACADFISFNLVQDTATGRQKTFDSRPGHGVWLIQHSPFSWPKKLLGMIQSPP